MHVGILQAFFTREHPRGAEVYVENLARALSDRGHRVTVLTDARERKRESIDDLDVREYAAPVDSKLATDFILGRRARQFLRRCDVALLADTSGWYCRKLSTPTVAAPHLIWRSRIRRRSLVDRLRNPDWFVYRRMERQIFQDADCVVAITPDYRAGIRDSGCPEGPVRTIPNPVDTDRFVPTDETSDEFTVHFQGHLTERKRAGVLIEALDYATRDWRLTIGGTGPRESRLRELTERLGVDSRVEFLGYVSESDLADRYARSDLHVLPSRYEGMPLTVLEAAACGLPSVVSEHAAGDFVDATVGRIAPATPSAFARVIDGLARRPSEVQKLGRAARRRAETRSWTRTTDAFETVFRNLHDRSHSGNGA